MTELETKNTIPAPPPEESSILPGEGSLIGKIIDGRYRIESLLGEGGMGAVYKVRHTKMGKDFALKLIHSELSHITEIAKRFEREAKSSSKLTDPHCISVTDFGRTEDNNLYLVMELLTGEELENRIEREGRIELPEALEITKQILVGLNHAHQQGIVHRDLKPENIFLVEQGDGKPFAKILDFGIAKMGMDGGNNDKLTKTGIVYGTPKYLSPEQALGDKVDHRADIYSVGIILFEMITGQPPFAAKSAMDTMSMHLTADVPKISEFGKFSRSLQTLLNTAMAKRPEERFKDVGEFLQELGGIDPDSTGEISITNVLPDFSHLNHLTDGVKKKMTKKRGTTLKALIGLVVVVSLVLGAGAVYWKLVNVKKVGPSQQVVIDSEEAQLSNGEIATEDDKLKPLFEKINTHMENEEFEEAAEVAREAIKEDQESPEAKFLLGHALFASNKRIGGLYQYRQAIEANGKLAQNEIFLKNLTEGLKWKECQKKAAIMLATYGAKKDIDYLVSLSNSAIIDGDVRRAARAALEKVDKSDLVDWKASLIADFHETELCKTRKAVVGQMTQTQDRSFIEFLKNQKRKTRNRKMRKCIVPAFDAAIKTLKELPKSPR